ncbi:colicin-like bacteriocin tRNase domain-containing protein, partial [Klebsiella pneumoniae]|uniref:colicin-like bacteriocin tRNase domain-containing protein n=1 Tax=Klebsiella pneumoniae TaxID=573 RepID=UPI003F806693
MTSLAGDGLTETPACTFPLDQATVGVRQRVVVVVKDERQNFAVVAGRPMCVPVVYAKPTKRPGV